MKAPYEFADKPPIIIASRASETPWAQSVQKESQNDLFWIGACIAGLGAAVAIGSLAFLFMRYDVVFSSESSFSGFVTICMGATVAVMIGMWLLILRTGRAAESAASAILATVLSMLIGFMMVVAMIGAFLVFLFVACLNAVSGGQ